MTAIGDHERERRRRFEAEALPHLDAAYRLARWLARRPGDADDVVQDAMLRAWRGFDGRHGTAVRPWLLAIVRNCFLSHAARQARDNDRFAGGDFEVEQQVPTAAADDPLAASIRSEQAGTLAAALAALPEDFRTVLVLREIEDLSYREIAHVLETPIGTVMSRLARAREALRRTWRADHRSEPA